MIVNQLGYNPDYSEDAPTLEQITGLIGITILEFGAPWCGHCLAAEPAVKAVLASHLGVQHIKIFDGKGKVLGRKFRVKLWPTLILLKDGIEIGRLIRPTQTNEIQQLIALL